MPSRNLQEIVEYRGVEGLVAAEVLTDDNGTGGYTTGEVFAIAGVAEISKTTDAASESHYYDNLPAVVVMNNSSDELTINVSAIPFDVLAEITGQHYDTATGALIEGQRHPKYFALGYKTKKTNGDEVYVWRYKGTFNIPDQTNATEDDSTDANGQELVYTGISTTHKFEKTGEGAKALNVDVAKNLADVDNFFETVKTPDSLEAKAQYTLTITAGGGSTIVVLRGSESLQSGATIYKGDRLIVYMNYTSGSYDLTINGDTVTNPTDYTVSGDTLIVSA